MNERHHPATSVALRVLPIDHWFLGPSLRSCTMQSRVDLMMLLYFVGQKTMGPSMSRRLTIDDWQSSIEGILKPSFDFMFTTMWQALIC